MSTLVYKGQTITARPGESVLDCLERNRVAIASSCRSGVCQSCLVQGASPPPPKAQKGLSRSLSEQNFLLACQCSVEESPELVEDVELPVFESRVTRIVQKAEGIYQVFIERPADLHYEGGQFVPISSPEVGVTRSYSIASGPNEEELELHVERLPGGRMSGYLTENDGVPLQLRSPSGECRYSGNPEEHLVLAGTGTGLAPLMGVVRTALHAGHVGPIDLYHGATHADRLYLHEELKLLAEGHDNLTYDESVLHGAEGDSRSNDLAALIKERFPTMAGSRVYLCGNPDLVARLKKQCFLSGTSFSMIHSDPFIVAPHEEDRLVT